MGGKGAKERRRLARLAANNANGGEQESKDSPSSPAPPPVSNTTTKSNHHHQNHGGGYRKKQQERPAQQSRPSPAARGRHSGGENNRSHKHISKDGRPPASKPIKTEKKKKKVKKPKHLKRKIEKLSAEENEAERQRLLNELKEFDERKAAMSAKRRKPNNGSIQKNNIPVSKPSHDSTSVENKVKDAKPVVEKVAAVDDTAETVGTTDPALNKDDPVVSSEMDAKAQTATNNDDSDSDSDSDVSLEDATKRQRGRRRRGRKTTEEHTKSVQLQSPPLEQATKRNTPTKIQIPTDNPKLEDKSKKSDPTKKTSKKDDPRRCIGRKPVTEFVIGQRYPGKVIYTKEFGAFIDIGCHSDAFCHISRVRDDYVESIDDALSIGQEVSARVVEVDRKAKRITVSLQSDARLQDERASVEARKERKDKHARRKQPSAAAVDKTVASLATVPPVASPQPVAAPPPPPPMDESTMTPAELKRARKLARRAARREQQAQTGLAA